MSHFTDRVDCSRGAPLGRPGAHNADAAGRFTLQRVRLDSGGYDTSGAYWGRGEPLYYYASADASTEGYFRLDRTQRSLAMLDLRQAGKFKSGGELSREGAKRQLREDFPNAQFYR